MLSISIPISIESIGYNAFGSCSNLNSISTVRNWGGVKYYSNNGVLFEYGDGKNVLIAYPMGKSDTSYTIPNDVAEIGDGAFSYCNNLTSITFPTTITSIGEGAFEYCDKLTSITLPESLTSIGNHAFFNSGLETVVIPQSVTSIGDYAFYCCDLKTVIIPDGVTSIGVRAFSRCNNLASVYISNSVTKFGIMVDEMMMPLVYCPFDQSDIKDIYYSGTQKEWEKLLADSKWDGTILTNDFSTYNPTVHFNSHIPGTKLPAPMSLSADFDSSPTTATLTWESVEYATNYKVTYWESDEDSEVMIVKTDTNSIQLEGLSPNTEYTFMVVAMEDDTEGEVSEEYKFETAQEENLSTSESVSDTNESSSESIESSSESIESSDVEENVNDNSNISSEAEGNSFSAIFIIVPIIVVAVAVAVVLVIIVLKKRK